MSTKYASSILPWTVLAALNHYTSKLVACVVGGYSFSKDLGRRPPLSQHLDRLVVHVTSAPSPESSVSKDRDHFV